MAANHPGKAWQTRVAWQLPDQQSLEAARSLLLTLRLRVTVTTLQANHIMALTEICGHTLQLAPTNNETQCYKLSSSPSMHTPQLTEPVQRDSTQWDSLPLITSPARLQRVDSRCWMA